MLRIIESFYLFVCFFNILFFIVVITDTLREVNNGLHELQQNIDTATNRKMDIEIPLVGISVLKSWPYLLHSIIPIWHLALFYTFITKRDKIYDTFYKVFQGKAIKNVSEVMESIGVKDFNKEMEENHDDVL